MEAMNSQELNYKDSANSEYFESFPANKTREFVLVQKIQGALRNLPDFAETCKQILDALMDEVNAENCSIMLKDPVSGELTIRAARGKNERKTVFYPGSSRVGKSFKPGEGIAGWVWQEGKAVLINDVHEEPRFVEVAGLGNNVRSLICLPIMDKGQVVGVFNISHSQKGAFDEGDKLALAYISTQVGAALTSARFFLEMQEMNRLMKKGDRDQPQKTSATFVEVGEMMARDQGIFIYASEKMRRIKEIIDQVANTDVTVLIQGESGVGKEVVARSLHLNSFRRDKPFVKVNCAALPAELLESELFGYEKGAFTGAYRRKPGKFELANGGTIFLDEIGEISPYLQAKLLQVIQDHEFSRLGGKNDVKVDVRILVATNRNIEQAVKDGRFREDLYYRLNVVNITVPPLRVRKEEIPVFIEYFANKFAAKFNKQPKPLTENLWKAFYEYHWPGNIRELENLIQRYIVLGDEEEIIREISNFSRQIASADKEIKSGVSLKEINKEKTRQVEREAICRALEQTNWNRKKAAQLLRISYKSLLNKIKELGI
ncbi:MAG: sigma-54-dependent Fis family transcriptional regulator [Thermodesulfobacteriota bacterium]